MASRNRSYGLNSATFMNNFDYAGVGALGDVQYDDGYDDWDDILGIFETSGLDVPVVSNHENPSVIARIKNFHLDHGKKQVFIGFNKDNQVSGYEIEDFNGVSPRWLLDEHDKIVGVEHFAIGNGFYPKCDKNTCNVRNRGEEMTEENHDNQEEEIPETPEFDYKAAYEGQAQQLETLNGKFTELVDLITKAAAEEEEMVLDPIEELQGEIQTKAPKDKSEGFFSNITKNTQRIANLRK